MHGVHFIDGVLARSIIDFYGPEAASDCPLLHANVW